MLALHILQHGHLQDNYLVEFQEALALRHTFMDKDRIFKSIEFDAFKTQLLELLAWHSGEKRPDSKPARA